MIQQCVTPLYQRHDWPRWVSVFKDTDSPMTESFDVWHKDHLEQLEKLKAMNIVVHKIQVDFDAFVDWIGANDLPINGATRGEFATVLLEARMRESGDL